MNRIIRSALAPVFAGALVIAAASSAFASDWDVDAAHTHVGFGIRHMMVSTVRGAFDKFSGTVALDDKDISKSKIHIDIDATSINTGNAKRDEHLKSPDFFDVAKFPKITFDATKVEKKGADALDVTGNLTMKGVTKPVVLTVTGISGDIKDPWGTVHKGAKATASINRKDFNVAWNKALESGGVVLDETVKLDLEIELTKKKVDVPASTPAK